MTNVKRIGALTWMAAVLAGFVLAACGGGGDGDVADGPGRRTTDPALVPTSTPMQDPVLYKIQNNTISTDGGAAATVAPGNATTPRAGRQTYTVESGDTCGGIASKLGVTLEELLKVNRSIDAECRNIRAGDELVVPGGTSSPNGNASSQTTPTPTARSSANGRTHTVADGENCESIAASNGVSVSDLLAANPVVGSGCTNLQIGQELKIP